MTPPDDLTPETLRGLAHAIELRRIHGPIPMTEPTAYEALLLAHADAWTAQLKHADRAIATLRSEEETSG